MGRRSDESRPPKWSYGSETISEVIVFHPTTPTTTIKGRSPKPRAFVLPVVRPAPPRPAATGSAGTW